MVVAGVVVVVVVGLLMAGMFHGGDDADVEVDVDNDVGDGDDDDDEDDYAGDVGDDGGLSMVVAGVVVMIVRLLVAVIFHGGDDCADVGCVDANDIGGDNYVMMMVNGSHC